MMNELRSQDRPQAANDAHIIEKLDSWLTCHNLAESFLIITNFLLLLKSSSNLVAVFNVSKSLIVDYNGAILFSDGFRWCFLIVNIGILCGSTICLAALLFVSIPKTKLRLLKCFVIAQLSLALVTLVLMGRLWFVPFKLELDPSAWKRAIRGYNYQFRPDTHGLWPIGLPLRTHDPHSQDNFHTGHTANAASYDYRDKVDRLQQALGCCGVWGSTEWRQNELLGLLAPSCCTQPTRVDVELPVVSGPIVRDQNETQFPSILVYNLKQIFYCQWVQDGRAGCQQHLNDKETRFLFHLRLNLLLLMGVLVLNVISHALLKFNPIIDSTLVLRLEPTQQQQATGDISSNLPPSYEQLHGFDQQMHEKYHRPPDYRHKDLIIGQIQSTSPTNVKNLNNSSCDGHNSTSVARHDSIITQNYLKPVDAIRCESPKTRQPSGYDSQHRDDATVLTMS